MGKYYITGDTHGEFRRFDTFCISNGTSLSDIMIILGDVGLNFYLNKSDWKRKKEVSKLPLTFFCIHGNHEERPFLISSYQEKEWHGGMVYFEPEFSNLLFAEDGEIYDFGGKKAIVLGGAYSVDKFYRLAYDLPWFPSEQMTEERKEYAEKQLEEADWKVDYVFSHTCPTKYEPTDLYLDSIDQSTVDKSMEKWLEKIEQKLQYEKWYFGHYHENRNYEHAEMLFEIIKEL